MLRSRFLISFQDFPPEFIIKILMELTSTITVEHFILRILPAKSSIMEVFWVLHSNGDGDRFIALDEEGKVVNGDKLIGMAAVFLKSLGKLRNNNVVTTVMSNAGLEMYLKEHGIKLLRAGVGDKYVFEMMKETDSVLGGENSGHIILMDFNPTGDGMAAAMLTLSVMAGTGKKLSQLAEEIKLFPQVLSKIKVREKVPLEKVEGLAGLSEELENGLEGGRIFLRYSGTEAVLRILAEGPDEKKVKKAEEKIRDFFIEQAHMIAGIGTDIVEIERLRDKRDLWKRFLSEEDWKYIERF